MLQDIDPLLLAVHRPAACAYLGVLGQPPRHLLHQGGQVLGHGAARAGREHAGQEAVQHQGHHPAAYTLCALRQLSS